MGGGGPEGQVLGFKVSGFGACKGVSSFAVSEFRMLRATGSDQEAT